MARLSRFLDRDREVVMGLALLLLLVVSLVGVPVARADVGSISGIVTGPDGALPPPGTVVRLYQADHSTFGQANVGPGDGSFSFGAVPSGNYLLRAVPPGGSGLTPSIPLSVSVLGAPVNVGTVALTHPSIVGTVYAPDGTTPASAWIHVHSAGSLGQTSVAPGGEIRIGGLPAGTYQLQAWPMDDQPFWASDPLEVTVTPGVSQTISLTLTAADAFGRAVDALGNPVKDARARVLDASGQVVSRDLSSATGYFSVGGLAPGSYHLVLEPPWWEGALIPPAPVPFSVPPQQDLGAIAFRASAKIVTGRVQTNTGQPVLGALVDAHRLDRAGWVETLSGTGGQYAISLSEGLWSLTVKPINISVPANWLYPDGPQLAHFKHDTSPEAKQIDFRVLTADSNATGWVEMPGGGVPPFTVTVGIHSDAGAGRTQQIDPGDGSFNIALPHGAYKVTVVAHDRGYMGPPVAPIQLPPNSTLDLGALTLLERNATISGTVSGGGIPLEEIPVVAWRPDAPGPAHSHTSPGGGYVLAVVEGTWLVGPAPAPDQPWLYANQPREVEVPDGGAVSGVDFDLLAADARIRGLLVDQGGTPLTSVEGWVQARNVRDPAVQKGAPVEDGAFAVLVPGGTYQVSLKLPAGAPWLAPAPREVTVGSGGTADILFGLRPKDAAIAGALWDHRAEEPVTGVQAGVMAYGQGAWVRSAIDPGNGTYNLGVASGIWALGYQVDSASGYVALRQQRNYPVAAGQVVPAPLPVAYRDALMEGIVLDPGGAPLAGAVVVAEGLGGLLGDVSLDAVSGDDGRFALRLPHGHYHVRATIGGRDWINPVSRNVLVPEGGSVTGLQFQFVEPDATVGGTVTLGSRQEANPIHLWAYSEEDGYTRTQAEPGGLYALDVVSNTTWTVGATYQEGTSYWRASARVEVPPGGAALDLEMEGPFPLPAPVTVSFDASQEQYLELADGTGIYVPAGAMPVSGTVTLQVTPIATFPHQRHANVYRYGYAFTAADTNGQPIEQRFNQDVLITFPYDQAELARMGLAEQWLKPAYFSTTTDSWTFPQSYVVDTVANMVAMEIDHFTDFCLAGWTGTQVFLPLVIR